jgi:dTDP-4-amino-4,6-dideoxygalactose transaminase
VSAARLVVPLVDLHAALAPERGTVLRAFETVLDGMHLLLGPETQAFERDFADYCGVAHGVAMSSGTDALFAALAAAQIGPDDEVIVPAHTFFATVEAILHTGATPVFVDVEPARLTLDVEQVRAAISPATKAIVPVHLYGHPADMDDLLVLAAEHDLRVVEDAAQAHGARHRGRRCGSMGDAGCFSFYVTKNLAALGEGGFVTTNDATLAERVRLLRHHGHVSKFEHAVAGWNLRMDELQAAVLRVRLPRLDVGNARRRAIAARYREAFADTVVRELVPADETEAVHHLHPVRVTERDALRQWLAERGIETGMHYPVPAHRQPALHGRPHRCQGALPVTEAACAELLSLPIYPELRDEQVDLVIAGVRGFLDSRPATRRGLG